MAEYNINRNYFSGSQASLFIGDVWVDDIFGLSYNVQQGKTPKYGYGSQHFDFVAKGTMLVSGTFMVNFREPNYLWLILERYKTFNQTKEERLIDEEKARKKTDSETYPGDRRQRFDIFFNSIDPKSAQATLVEQAREFNGVTEDNSAENFNHRTFDILIGYGHELNSDSPGETIRGIHILNKAKTINADGRPIAEEYSFIARRLV